MIVSLNVDKLILRRQGHSHSAMVRVHVSTYYRNIRRPRLSCQSSHWDSIPGAQSEQIGLSLSAVACGAPRCQHSCFLQRSAEKKGEPVRSVLARNFSGKPYLLLHKLILRTYLISHVFQMKYELGENPASCLFVCLLVFRNT